ncbi:MAG: hypothetical protein ACJAS1_003831 [Oleiphilaceae bacterium]|jgi:hypothetical protein
MDTYSLVSYLPVIGRIRTNFYSCAAKTYEIYLEQNEFERQKGIKHLGLISRVFDSSNHTRYEYLMLQCALVDMVDSLNKGESQIALGALNTTSYSYKGNALLKTWFMLSNYGHCKNTYGDLKALLLFTLSNKLFQKELLATIKDSSLRNCCKNIIESYDYRRFNYVIAIYRLYTDYFNRQKKTLQLNALKLLLLDEADFPDLVKNWPKLNRLRRVLSTIRDISILSIDGHYTHTSISINLISAISSLADYEHAYNEYYLSDSLKPLLSILNEEIYLDKAIVAMQRTYEVKSAENIKKIASLEVVIKQGLDEGLVSEDIDSLKHFLRMKLPSEALSGASLYSDFRSLQLAKKGCENVELTLDINHYEKHRYMDVLIDEINITPREIGLIYYRLSKLVVDWLQSAIKSDGSQLLAFNKKIRTLLQEAGVNDAVLSSVTEVAKREIAPIVFDVLQRSVNPSYKSLLYSILTYLFDDKYKIDLEHSNSSYKSFDFCFDGGIDQQFKDNIQKAKEINASDVDRVHEIDVLSKQIRQGQNNYVYICLDRLLILDLSANPDNRKYTDLDGVVLFVSETEVKLEIIEAKNTAKPVKDAKKDIKNKLLPALNHERIKGYRIRPLKDKGAKLTIKF